MSLKAQLAQFTTIHTDRLLLRPVQLTDAPAMFDYLQDDDTMRYISIPPVKTLKEVVENSIKVISCWIRLGNGQLSMTKKWLGALIYV